MTIPTSAIKRDGIARTPDGAVYVQVEPDSTISNPTFTGIPIGVAYPLAHSFVGVSGAADTNENTLATITLPAGALGANGYLEIEAKWTYTNSANNKTLRVKFGATTLYSLTATTTAAAHSYVRIGNANAANAQVSTNWSYVGANTLVALAGAANTATIDTSAAVPILITGQKASGAEALTLDFYTVKVVRLT